MKSSPLSVRAEWAKFTVPEPVDLGTPDELAARLKVKNPRYSSRRGAKVRSSHRNKECLDWDPGPQYANSRTASVV